MEPKGIEAGEMCAIQHENGSIQHENGSIVHDAGIVIDADRDVKCLIDHPSLNSKAETVLVHGRSRTAIDRSARVESLERLSARAANQRRIVQARCFAETRRGAMSCVAIL